MKKSFCIISLGALLLAPNILLAATQTVVIPLLSKQYFMAQWRGEWEPRAMYKANDAIQYGGSSYLCLENHIADLTTAPELDMAKWSLVAAGGEQGESGEPGYIGPAGPSGPRGSTGSSGPQGAPGEKGETGATGAGGEKGEKGDAGAKGESGEAGANGEKGDTGETGAAGSISNKTCPKGETVVGFKDNVPLCTGEVSYPKTVFLTSTAHTGDMGGIAGADTICNDLAKDAELSGTFKAWLSTDSSSPKTHWNATSRDAVYELVNGTTVAISWQDLTDGALNTMINIDETGHVQSETYHYPWTNTNNDGAQWGGSDSCSDWTSSDSFSFVMAGNYDGPAFAWTAAGTEPCSETHRLYCFEQ